MAERPAKTFKETFSSISISMLGVSVAGFAFGQMTPCFKLIPGLLIIVPAMLNMRGCISGALAMRLGTAIHMGIIGWKLGHEERKQNIYASLLLTVLTSVFIGVLADLTCRLLGFPSVGIIWLTLIALLAGGLAGLVMISLTMLVATYSSIKGLDPDNVTIPVIAMLGDVIGISCLFLVAIALGGLM